MVRNIIIAVVAIIILYFILVWAGVFGGDEIEEVPQEPVLEEGVEEEVETD